jgi:uncharacterized circularly permuted ATP-grasp superfamily protein
MAPTRSASEGRSLFDGYEPLPGTFDEFVDPEGKPHDAVADVVRLLDEIGRGEFKRRKKLADVTFLRGGVTFSTCSGDTATERIFPFDLIPRVIAASEWERVEKGLEQRIRALNLFLADIYGDQRILEEDVVPRSLVQSSTAYRKEMRGIRPPGGVYIHIAGIDLIRDANGDFVVLEDNVRTPSGVSYVLENRARRSTSTTWIRRWSRCSPGRDSCRSCRLRRRCGSAPETAFSRGGPGARPGAIDAGAPSGARVT